MRASPRDRARKLEQSAEGGQAEEEEGWEEKEKEEGQDDKVTRD